MSLLSELGSDDLERPVVVAVVPVRVVQVTVDQVVHVVPVLDGLVAAVGAMGVIVVLVLVAAHIRVFLRLGASVQSSSWACSSTPFTSSAT